MKFFNLTLIFATTLFIQCNKSSAQQIEFPKDESGNPIVNQDFIDTVVMKMKFERIEDGSITLNELKGKVLVIDFWQTWCSPCIAAFKGFQEAKNKYPYKIEILTASPDWADNRRKIKKFIRKKDYDFEFIWAGELENMLGLKSIPYKIIIDENGKLVKTKSGTDGPKNEFSELEKLIKLN